MLSIIVEKINEYKTVLASILSVSFIEVLKSLNFGFFSGLIQILIGIGTIRLIYYKVKSLRLDIKNKTKKDV